MACLVGQARAGQAWRAPQCLTCSWGSAALTAPRGSRVSSIPILAPGQDPESSCGVGGGGELREEERAYLINTSSASGFAWFVPQKPHHQGDPPWGPEFTCQGASPTDHSGREGGTGEAWGRVPDYLLCPHSTFPCWQSPWGVPLARLVAHREQDHGLRAHPLGLRPEECHGDSAAVLPRWGPQQWAPSI